jgi:ferric-dicitrate binding protein FerR (iron transport regulator)
MSQTGVAEMMTLRCRREPGPVRYSLVALAAVCVVLGATAPLFGEPDGCVLAPDDRNPSEKILRCGDALTIRTAPDTRYRLTAQVGQQRPSGAQLDSGALMIEFTPSEGRRKFQILTPHAIAAVRGTTWAVEVEPERTSTLVISGTVQVTRPRGKRSAVLHAGEGADVSAGSDPITVKIWGKKRVDALLARFGQ